LLLIANLRILSKKVEALPWSPDNLGVRPELREHESLGPVSAFGYTCAYAAGDEYQHDEHHPRAGKWAYPRRAREAGLSHGDA
jgi:hypothetical protein